MQKPQNPFIHVLFVYPDAPLYKKLKAIFTDICCICIVKCIFIYVYMIETAVQNDLFCKNTVIILDILVLYLRIVLIVVSLTHHQETGRLFITEGVSLHSAVLQKEHAVHIMIKRYLDLNVYEALLERFHFIFQEFDSIYISFSGGKDSGLLLYLLLDFRDWNYPDKTIGVFHQDFEAQYSATTRYLPDAGKTPSCRIVLDLPSYGYTYGTEQL